MQKLYEKVNRWLLPVLVLLALVGTVTFSFAVRYAYAGSSQAPGHVLTYTRNKLRWDSSTGIDSNGVAVLRLFDGQKPAVAPGNVVAPGTSGGNTIRLTNSSSGTVGYTAVLYQIRSSDELAVEAVLTGEALTDTDTYPLPKGVQADQVLRAVTGKLDAKKLQDFAILWSWEEQETAEQDAVDTRMGIAEESTTVGLYIVVEDNNADLDYVTPQTGDSSALYLHIALVLVSGMLLLFLLGERKEAEWTEC